jgi:hypothetical protein
MISYLKSLFSKNNKEDTEEIEEALRKFHHRNSQSPPVYQDNNVNRELEDVVTTVLINAAFDSLTSSESCDILTSSTSDTSDWSGGGGDFSGGGADGNF